MTDFAIATQNMTSTVLAPKKLPLIYAGLFGAAMTFAGPTAGITAPSVPSMEFALSWTTGVNAPASPDTASAVRRVKERSGLSWQQLADAFGVSRRSLHFWANGGNMAATSVQRLDALSKAVESLGAAEPAAARAALLSTRPGGGSPFTELVAEVTPRRLMPRTNIDAQLNAVDSGTKHPGKVRTSKPVPVKLAEF